jgi:phage tail-like protein
VADHAANGGDSRASSQYFARARHERRLFSTRSLRLPDPTDGDGAGPPSHRPDPPPVATLRRLYRDRLPGIYHQNGDFGLRFVSGLEGVLDPIVALLDSLPAHFDPDLAPQDLLEVLAGWLGVELDESWPDERRRELVRRAGELSRLRGTRAGLELALSVAFPDLPLRVEDQGRVAFAADLSQLDRVEAPSFVVYCDRPLEEDVLASVARVIERVKPVHVRYRLRVKALRAERS